MRTNLSVLLDPDEYAKIANTAKRIDKMDEFVKDIEMLKSIAKQNIETATANYKAVYDNSAHYTNF